MVIEVLTIYAVLMIIALPLLRTILRGKLSSERGFLISYILAYVAPLYMYCAKYSLVHALIGLSALNILAIMISVVKPICTWLGVTLVPILIFWVLVLTKLL